MTKEEMREYLEGLGFDLETGEWRQLRYEETYYMLDGCQVFDFMKWKAYRGLL